MARPLRIELEGAYYHVFNRGNKRQEVYDSKFDYEMFIDRLTHFSAIYDVCIISYCLMPNHFHLYIKTNEANLSRFMQALLTSYTIIKNRKDNTVGHIFQGRFKSILVENNSYGSKLSRYIHLNPTQIESCKILSIAERKVVLKKYRWSSYSAIIGLTTCPNWIKKDLVLDVFGGNIKDSRINYANFVEKGLLDNINSIKEEIVAQSILGTDGFVDKIRHKVLNVGKDINLRRELSNTVHFRSSVKFETLVKVISNEFNIETNILLTPNSRIPERQILIYLASTMCRGRYTLTAIGQMLGISLGGVSGNKYKFNRRLMKDKKLRKTLDKIKKIFMDIK